jgi:hypothetical protein
MRNFGLLFIFSIFLAYQLAVAAPEGALSWEIWTDAQGRGLRGQLVRAAGTQIRMRLADGSMPSIPLERFCHADQRRILLWMVDQPAALEYAFEVGVHPSADGRWQVLVTNRSKNTLPDVQVEARETPSGGSAAPVIFPGRFLGRLEPGGRVMLTVEAAESAGPRANGAAGSLQIRLCRGQAVVWEWSHPARNLTDWPLRPGQVRVPATGMPSEQVIASLLPVGRSTGSGKLGAPARATKEETVVTAQEDGEDLVRIFEGP